MALVLISDLTAEHRWWRDERLVPRVLLVYFMDDEFGAGAHLGRVPF